MQYLKLLLTLLMLTAFLYSSEETPTKEEVAKLYVATFNRAPDSDGLNYWTNDSGLKLSQIAQSFFDQEETKTLYPANTTNRDFISYVYQNLFNRVPDTDGWDYWENELNNGIISKNRFIQAVINGAKGSDVSILTNKTRVGLSFYEAGLNSTDDAKSIMVNVSDDEDTVTSAVAEFGITLYTLSEIITHSGLTYKTVTSSTTQRVWLDRNLGATQACTSQNDEECYGDYYQWGRSADGHEKSNSSITLKIFPSSVTNNDKFVISALDWTDSDTSGAIRNKNWDVCPSGFRVPTIDELLAEKISSDVLNLPLSGNRTKHGYMKEKGSDGYLLSSTPSSTLFSKLLRYNGSYSAYNLANRTVGAPVRCIEIPKITGVFIDSAVSGLSYTCSSGNSGVTNSAGEFTCQVGDMVSFSLGNLYLGEILAQEFITPHALFAGNEEAALNFAQLLQTLDRDGDLSNGIDINEELLATLGAIDFFSQTFDEDIQMLLSNDIVLVIEEEAQQHLDETFTSLNIDNIGIKTFWNTSSWSVCSSNNQQIRTISCKNLNGDVVNDEYCTNIKPEISQSCVSATIEHNGVNYATVVSPYTGKTWLDRNLGASQVCTALDDTACYGDYYQWGRNTDGHQVSRSATTAVQAVDINNAGTDFITSSNFSSDWTAGDDDGASRSTNWSKIDGTSVCPVGYRVPTITELADETTSASTAITNNTDAFNNFLKLPSAGYRSNNAIMNSQGARGVVWSNSVNPFLSYILYFYSANTNTNGSDRANGYSIRCLKDDSTPPIFISSATESVNENQTSALTLAATDESTITYSISGGDSASFDVNATTGVVTFKVAPDFETKASYTFTATATDSSNNSVTQAVSITILDLADNIALNKTVTPFTNLQFGEPSFVTDGNNLNVWYSYNGNQSVISFTIDLEDEYAINKLAFIATQTRNYTIESSFDNVNWTVRHNETGLDFSQNVVENIIINPTYFARYLKYTGSNGNDQAWIGVVEFEAYGTISTAK